MVADTLEYHGHRGKAWFSGTSVTIAGGATYYIIGKTGDKAVHMKSRHILVTDLGSGDINVTTSLYQDPTVTSEGTPVTVYNNMLELTNGNTFEIFKAGTVSADGTLLPKGGRIRAEKKSSSNIPSDIEYIMKRNSYYLVKVVNSGVSSIEYDIKWDWYEDDYDEYLNLI